MRLNREDVSHGALIVGKYDTSQAGSTPLPTGIVNPPLDWGVLSVGATPDGYVLTTSSAAAAGVAWGATGGLTVGAPVASAVANALFYTTAAGNIGASSTLTYDGASTISSTAASLKISSVTQTQFNGSGYYNYYSFCYGTSPVLGIFASSVASSTIGFSNIDSEINFAQHSTIFVTPYNAATTPFAVRGLASQTAPLFPLQQLSSTATARNCGIIDASFNTATDASWTGNLLLYAGDNTSSKRRQAARRPDPVQRLRRSRGPVRGHARHSTRHHGHRRVRIQREFRHGREHGQHLHRQHRLNSLYPERHRSRA